MGQIRSALDIALEKTAHIEGDPKSADNRELRNSGKKAAGDYLVKGIAGDLSSLLEGKDTANKKLITEGAVSILLASLHIPADETDLAKAERIGAGLDAVLPDTGMTQLFSQVSQILKQYLTDLDQLSKALEQQFMPRLRAKQQELTKRYGQNIPMDIHQDSEYLQALSKNKRALEDKYEGVIDEVRSRVHEIAGIAEE